MTMICEAPNKLALKAKLEAGCTIEEPTPFGSKFHDSKNLAAGFRDAVVLDPQTRRRFATIERKVNGWKVS